MASYIYPAIFQPDAKDGGYFVTFPDLPGCVTEGKDLDEALYMAQDVLPAWLETAIETGCPIPPASEVSAVHLEHGAFASLVRAERKDSRAVRRTVSIPKWLDEKASAAGLSLSRILQDALRERLGER